MESKQKKKSSKTWKIVGAAILGLMIIGFLSKDDKEEQGQPNNIESDTVDVVDKQQKIEQDSIALTQAKTTFQELKGKFKFKKDEFEDIGWYSHKNWGNHWLARKGLTVDINSTGYIYLCSNWYDNDWLFHHTVRVLVDGSKLETAKIESYSKEHKTEIADGGYVYEVNYYTKGRDNGIIKLIAENSNKKIKVRFVGKEFHSDITLSSTDKKAIKDGYLFAQALQEIHRQQAWHSLFADSNKS